MFVAEKIKNGLDKLFPNPRCELKYKTAYQLLVAVILSAQCTDKRVNIVTEKLFEKYDAPEKILSLTQEQLEDKIRSCGFYHNKAKNILSMTKDLIEKFNGEVPSDEKDLQSLAGVGRKTANVVIGEFFKGQAIAVDTHVLRVSNRLGLVKTENPLKCEMQLNKIFNKKDWATLHLQMVLFGRYICKSQKPACENCPFFEICVSDKKHKWVHTTTKYGIMQNIINTN